MSAGEKRFSASCTVERAGQGGLPMMGAARSASLRDVAPLNAGTARLFWRGAPMCHSTLALPGLSGRSHSALALPEKTGKNHPYATQLWHCQCFLAFGVFSPPGIGTARDCWRGRGPRHPGLALPGFSGGERSCATQNWHCQGILALSRPVPRPSRRILRTATPLVPTATRASLRRL